MNSSGDEYTIEAPEDAQVMASAIVWPSVAWATMQSTGNVMPDTLTIRVTPTAMTAPQEKAYLLIIADERVGTFPSNVKVAEVTSTKRISSLVCCPGSENRSNA
ncbi:MAG: hypothetical protein R2856_30965 [Caldilineaceae bacterium]